MANQGFGCLGLSGAYASFVETTPEVTKAIVHHVVDKGIAYSCHCLTNLTLTIPPLTLGVTLFNSSTHYGVLNEVGFGGNLRILGKAMEGLDRSKIQLMVKIGLDTK